MAVTSSKYGLKEVLEIKLFDLSTDNMLAILEDVKETSLSHNQEDKYAMGARGNVPLVGFSDSKDIMISGSSALIEDNMMAVQLGVDIETLTATTEIIESEVVTITTNASATTYTAIGTADAEMISLNVLNTDGSLGAALAQGAAAAAGVYQYTSGTKALDFNAGDYADATKVRVTYYKTVSSAKKMTSSSDVFSKEVKVVADGLFRDICTGEDYLGQIVFDKAKVSGTFDLALSSDGDPAVQNFEIKALKPCDSTDMMKIYVFDGDDAS